MVSSWTKSGIYRNGGWGDLSKFVDSSYISLLDTIHKKSSDIGDPGSPQLLWIVEDLAKNINYFH